MHRLKKMVGLTLSQLDMNAAASQRNFGTVQVCRLTSPHSFLNANPLALSGSVSVANPSDGHRNCQTVEEHYSERDARGLLMTCWRRLIDSFHAAALGLSDQLRDAESQTN